MTKRRISLFIILFLSPPFSVFASHPKTTAGQILTETSNARATALGGAFTAARDDVSAAAQNPASLSSLESGQASFLYDKGLADTTYGQLMIGLPKNNQGWGLIVGTFDGGTAQAFDGVSAHSMTIEKDLAVSLGYAHRVGSSSLGVSAKYLSSTLAETEKATAYAADFGYLLPLSSRFNFGAALQNIGSKLQYISEKESLPTLARVGLSAQLPASMILFLDSSYLLSQKEIQPAVGLEKRLGPLALRAGYKGGSDVEGLSFGAGFLLGGFNLDYVFGFSQNLENRQKVSVTFRFGPAAPSPKLVQSLGGVSVSGKYEKKKETPAIAFLEGEKSGEIRKTQFKSLGGQTYEVTSHDTLGKIAQRMYGDTREWKRIYEANRHLIDNPSSLEVGQKLSLP